MIETSLNLPENYEEIYSLDLKNNKKTALIMNLVAAPFAIILFIIGYRIVPFVNIFEDLVEDGSVLYLIKLGVLAVGLFGYVVLHELVHGIFMKAYSKAKVRYKLTLLYACAGNDAYYNKKHYIIIALAPIVIWGIVLGVLCAVLPSGWFWVCYIIQMINITGAVGDLFVTFKLLRMPHDVLINDIGDIMRVFAPKA